MANYETERVALNKVFEDKCLHRIVFYQGESGYGKTELLKQYCNKSSESFHLCPIQLRSSGVSIAEIFYRSGRILHWEHFTAFTRVVANFEAGSHVQIDKNWIIGINNHIHVALNTDNARDREYRYAALTEAWFEDLARLDRLIIFLFDTYEDATTDVQTWMSGPFLARTVKAEKVRVVVAGRKVPEENNIEWGQCCTKHDLFGVHEAKHWMPIIHAKKKLIHVQDPESWLAGLCTGLKGNPSAIMNVIDGLPHKS